MANWAKLQEELVGLPVAKRARHGIHFQRPDGLIEASFSGKPCHYFEGGLWKPIDTRLIQLPNGMYGAPHSDVSIHIDGRVRVKDSSYQQFTELPSAKVGKLAGDRIIREFPGGEQHLIMTEDGFRSEITLTRVPTNAEAKKLIAAESGGLPGKYRRSDTTATDAAGDVHEYKSLGAFQKWLAKAKYPVVIDPDFAGDSANWGISGNNADYATARATSSVGASGAEVAIIGQRKGYTIYRGGIKFNTSSIGAGSDVTQVNLNLVCTIDQSSKDFDLQIIKFDWSSYDPYATANRESNYDGCLSSAADDSVWRNTSGMSVNTQYTSGNLSTSWIEKAGNTYYGLRSKDDADSTAPVNLNERIYIGLAENATEAYRPVLTVTYELAATGGGLIAIPAILNSTILEGFVVR